MKTKYTTYAFISTAVISLGLLTLFGCGGEKRERAAFVYGCLTGTAAMAQIIGIPETMLNWESFRLGCDAEFDAYKKPSKKAQ